MKLLLTFVWLLAFQASFSQQHSWFHNFDASTFFPIRLHQSCITTNNKGELYTILSFYQDSAVVKVGGRDSILLRYNGNSLLAQVDSLNGEIIWLKQFGGTGTITATGININTSNNIYIVGNYRDTADFNPGIKKYILTAKSHQYKAFILKLNPNGDFKWVKDFGNNSSCTINSIEFGANSNILLSGSFSNTQDFDPDTSKITRSSFNIAAAFVALYDSTAKFKFVRTYGGAGYDRGITAKYDNNGFIYFLSNFEGDLSKFRGIRVIQRRSNGESDILLSKLDTLGNEIWVKQIGGRFQDLGKGIEIDRYNNIYLCGEYSGTVHFDTNNLKYQLKASQGSQVRYHSQKGDDVFVLKLDNLGKVKWLKDFGGMGLDRVASFDLTQNDMLLIGGDFSDTIDFQTDSSKSLKIVPKKEDMFLTILDSKGDYIRHYQFMVDKVGQLLNTTTSGDNIYMSGYYFDTLSYRYGNNQDTSFHSTRSRNFSYFLHHIEGNQYTVGLENNLNQSRSVLAYPNPTNGSFHIRTEKTFNMASIRIRDVQGRHVADKTYTSSNQIDLLIDGMNGIYFVEVTIDNQPPTFIKVIKQ